MNEYLKTINLTTTCDTAEAFTTWGYGIGDQLVSLASKVEVISSSKGIPHTELKKSCEAVNYKVYGDTVVVFFADGTKTSCTCRGNDRFDLEEGIFMCIVKKLHGNTLRNDARALVKKVCKAEKERARIEEESKAAKQKAEARKCKKIEQNLRRKAKREAAYQEMLKEEIAQLSKSTNA